MECKLKKKISGESYLFLSGEMTEEDSVISNNLKPDDLTGIKELMWNNKNNIYPLLEESLEIKESKNNQLVFGLDHDLIRIIFWVEEDKVISTLKKLKPLCEIRFTPRKQKYLRIFKEIPVDEWVDTGIPSEDLLNLDGVVYLEKVNKFNKEKEIDQEIDQDKDTKKRYTLFWFNPEDDLTNPLQIITLDVVASKILIFESKEKKKMPKSLNELKQKKIMVKEKKQSNLNSLNSYSAGVCPVDKDGVYLIEQPMALNKKYLIGFIPDAYPGVSIKYNGEIFTASEFTDNYSALLFFKNIENKELKSSPLFSIKYYCESAIAVLQYEGFTNDRFFATMHTSFNKEKQESRVSLLIDQPLPLDTFVFMGFPMNTATNLLKQVSSLYYLNKEDKFRLRDKNSKYLVFAKEGPEDSLFNQAIALDPVEYLLFRTEVPKKKRGSNALPDDIFKSFDLDLDWK